jgi:hypothetical protein
MLLKSSSMEVFDTAHLETASWILMTRNAHTVDQTLLELLVPHPV